MLHKCICRLISQLDIVSHNSMKNREPLAQHTGHMTQPGITPCQFNNLAIKVYISTGLLFVHILQTTPNSFTDHAPVYIYTVYTSYKCHKLSHSQQNLHTYKFRDKKEQLTQPPCPTIQPANLSSKYFNVISLICRATAVPIPAICTAVWVNRNMSATCCQPGSLLIFSLTICLNLE